jgi:hypothetical protein
MEKYGRASQVTDDNIAWRMRLACWMNKATHTQYIFIAFSWEQCFLERALM